MRQTAEQVIQDIHDILWPPENPDEQWTSDTIELVAERVAKGSRQRGANNGTKPPQPPRVEQGRRGAEKKLSQLEFTDADMEVAERIAEKLGYTQFAYTSTSALIGLYCLKDSPMDVGGKHEGGCIIKTRELGFLFVADGEDYNLGYNWRGVEE